MHKLDMKHSQKFHVEPSAKVLRSHNKFWCFKSWFANLHPASEGSSEKLNSPRPDGEAEEGTSFKRNLFPENI